MRVALTITELHPGGAEKCLVNLALYLKAQGHEVAVWQLWPDPPADKTQLVDQLDTAGIPWHSGGARSALGFVRASRWLHAELEKFAPDVVQSFLFHANLASAFAKPKASTLFGGARVRQPERWRGIAQKWAAQRMQKLICVSSSVRDHCQNKEGIPSERLLVIPNGVDLREVPGETPCWSQVGLPELSKVILFVGRLAPQKGVLEWAKQLSTLLTELPDHHAVFIGTGPQEQALRESIQATSHQDRIHMLGYRSDALSWMKASEMLVLPARYEGMPNVVLEAMACRKPVVVFDVDGIRDLLGVPEEDPTAGAQIAERLDFVAFNERILALAQSPRLQNECADANWHRAEQSFNLEKQLAKYRELYLESLS